MTLLMSRLVVKLRIALNKSMRKEESKVKVIALAKEKSNIFAWLAFGAAFFFFYFFYLSWIY